MNAPKLSVNNMFNYLVLSILCFNFCYSQGKSDLEIARTIFNSYNFDSGSTGNNEIDSLNGELSFYKKYISSQDQQVCTFYPSCSEYSTLAFSNFNFILACLITCDRIHRCHHLSPEKYPIHFASGLQHDPIPVSESKDD